MIFHLALASDWAAAQRTGEYRVSTLGRTLEQEGFIHASADLGQAARVAARFYRDVREPLLLLTIDEDRIGAPVKREAPAEPSPTDADPTETDPTETDAADAQPADADPAETFPHIYGPLPVAAVISVTPYAL
jgi:uncharacterized protein (DUF952 family)